VYVSGSGRARCVRVRRININFFTYIMNTRASWHRGVNMYKLHHQAEADR
jgi:hypothetical protein